jgi:hypothetical protein
MMCVVTSEEGRAKPSPQQREGREGTQQERLHEWFLDQGNGHNRRKRHQIADLGPNETTLHLSRFFAPFALLR